MSGFRSPPVIAGGTIRTARFVRITGNFTVSESDDTSEFIYGISQEGTQDAPTDGSSVNAAEIGDQVEIHTQGETALLTAGVGGLNAGVLVMTDANGNGINATAGLKYGAMALETVAAGGLAQVQITLGELET